MAADTDAFAQDCADLARRLRAAPAAVRSTLDAELRAKVAEPLADRIGAAATGPWAAVLAAGVKVLPALPPTITVGGDFPRLSGGGGPGSVARGTEFGGGGRLGTVRSTPRRRAHRRHTTAQFRRNRHPFFLSTVDANADWVLETIADLTMTTLEEEVSGG